MERVIVPQLVVIVSSPTPGLGQTHGTTVFITDPYRCDVGEGDIARFFDECGAGSTGNHIRIPELAVVVFSPTPDLRTRESTRLLNASINTFYAFERGTVCLQDFNCDNLVDADLRVTVA